MTTTKATHNVKGSVTLETLESRQMMSVSMHDGVVIVTGTEANDTVQIFASDAGAEPMLCVQLSTNFQGTTVNFRLSEVTGVKVDGLGGNDQLFVDRTYAAFATPVTLFGGAGDDVLVGGQGIDELVGGTGADWIDAGEGAWLESSDEWIVRSENGGAAPMIDGAHEAVDSDSIAIAAGSDVVNGAGADRLMPADDLAEVEVGGTMAGLFGDAVVGGEENVWNL